MKKKSKHHPGLVFFDRDMLRRLRKGNEMTQRDLSDMTGISNAYLCQLETGRTSNPSLGSVVAIADAFKLPVESFIIRRRP